MANELLQFKKYNTKANQGKLIMKRVKHQIYIYSPKQVGLVMFDLKEKCLKKYRTFKDETKNRWEQVEQQYNFFRDYSVRDLQSEEPKFMGLIQKTKKINQYCQSLSTFFTRLGDALVYEGYEAEGIRTECSPADTWSSPRILKVHLHEYPKIVQKFFKETDTEVTCCFENDFKEDSEFITLIITHLYNVEMTNAQRKNFLGMATYHKNRFKRLIEEYKYEPKALIGYIVNYLKPFENMDYGDAISTLSDYYKMANEIGRNVKKYPKYLHSMHDIIQANYDAYEREYNEEMFYKKQNFDLEFEKKDFCIVVPKEPKEIISEGTSLNHCVGSYVDNIISGRCLIVFLRSKVDKEASLVTVEIVDKRIVQARGSYNRDLLKEEKEFLQEFAKQKKLEVKV